MDPNSRVQNSQYYAKKLFALKLKQAYETAPERIQQYLQAEIEYVLDQIKTTDTVLELGCGYGRVLKHVATKGRKIIGIDISEASLAYAKEYLKEISNVDLHFMTARKIQFPEESFDVVLGIQNAISAMKIDPEILITQALRVTKIGGKVILSSYSENIWEERLNWFIQQSQEGLLGEIDFALTGNGVIVCKDGFTATTFSVEDFQMLIGKMKLKAYIIEIDESSIFCIIEREEPLSRITK